MKQAKKHDGKSTKAENQVTKIADRPRDEDRERKVRGRAVTVPERFALPPRNLSQL